MVNFTVTPSSLESQALSKILFSERPEIDSRRSELQLLQSEQSAKLRELEDSLLNKISAVQGAILDDDSLVNTLETIKGEAADLNREALNTAKVMEEVKQISGTYESLATAMASVFFSMSRLADINYLYQFSLMFFLRVVEKTLHLGRQSLQSGGDDAPMMDSNSRLKVLSGIFYREISRRVLKSLKFEDKILFVVRLAQVFTTGQPNNALSNAESDLLYRGVGSFSTLRDESKLLKCKTALGTLTSLPDQVANQSLDLTRLEAFSGLLDSMAHSQDQWIRAYESETPEKLIPSNWIRQPASAVRVSLLTLLVIRALRPDRVTSALEGYVSSVFGGDFKWREYAQVDFAEFISRDSLSPVPVMLCSEAGQDVSSRVDTLASALGKQLHQVAMGSTEGYADADKCIAQASKTGAWVLLRNVHLCPDWLTALEKRLHSLVPHDSFRLFLTCEINPNLPTSLLRSSDMILVEASTGIKANLQRFNSSLPLTRVQRGPVERDRLYCLLAWLNAVVHERLRYAPLGWTKRYEFSEADTHCALLCIDQWVDSVAGKRTHVAPHELP